MLCDSNEIKFKNKEDTVLFHSCEIKNKKKSSMVIEVSVWGWGLGTECRGTLPLNYILSPFHFSNFDTVSELLKLALNLPQPVKFLGLQMCATEPSNSGYL